jgi:hypothetical protein
MPPLETVFTYAAVILALATAAGYGLLRGRVTALRDELHDEREGRASDQRRITQLNADLIESRSETKLLRSEIEAVGRQVRTEGYWQEVGRKLDAHNDAAEAYWARADARGEDVVATQHAVLDVLKELKPDDTS